MAEGEKNSEAIDVQMGIRLGALGHLLVSDTIVLTSSREGWTASWATGQLAWMRQEEQSCLRPGPWWADDVMGPAEGR